MAVEISPVLQENQSPQTVLNGMAAEYVYISTQSNLQSISPVDLEASGILPLWKRQLGRLENMATHTDIALVELAEGIYGGQRLVNFRRGLRGENNDMQEAMGKGNNIEVRNVVISLREHLQANGSSVLVDPALVRDSLGIKSYNTKVVSNLRTMLETLGTADSDEFRLCAFLALAAVVEEENDNMVEMVINPNRRVKIGKEKVKIRSTGAVLEELELGRGLATAYLQESWKLAISLATKKFSDEAEIKAYANQVMRVANIIVDFNYSDLPVSLKTKPINMLKLWVDQFRNDNFASIITAAQGVLLSFDNAFSKPVQKILEITNCDIEQAIFAEYEKKVAAGNAPSFASRYHDRYSVYKQPQAPSVVWGEFIQSNTDLPLEILEIFAREAIVRESRERFQEGRWITTSEEYRIPLVVLEFMIRSGKLKPIN